MNYKTAVRDAQKQPQNMMMKGKMREVKKKKKKYTSDKKKHEVIIISDSHTRGCDCVMESQKGCGQK